MQLEIANENEACSMNILEETKRKVRVAKGFLIRSAYMRDIITHSNHHLQ